MTRTKMILVAAALALAAGVGAVATFGGATAGTADQSAAQEQTAVFAIENMTCAACPITVRKAMMKVAGVKSVEVDFDAKTATVQFDPAKASPGDIAEASTNAGYPARAT